MEEKTSEEGGYWIKEEYGREGLRKKGRGKGDRFCREKGIEEDNNKERRNIKGALSSDETKASSHGQGKVRQP